MPVCSKIVFFRKIEPFAPRACLTDRRHTMTEERHGDDDRHLEQRLRELLEGASARPEADIPGRVNRAVLAMAEGKAAQIRHAVRRSRTSRFFRRAVAVAASIVLVTGLISVVLRRREGVGSRMAADSPVHEAAKTVDIVDAYTLARALAAGERPSSEHDHNRDGRVDASDVNHIARMAVSLGAKRVGKESQDA